MVYTDFYTVNEFSVLAGISRCFFRTSKLPSSGNYESHQPCTQPLSCRSDVPVGRYEICFAGFDSDLRTTRYAYALKVIEAAHEITLAKYPDWLEHEWVISEPGWRKLVFKSEQRFEAEEYCESQIRAIADSGKIVVSELLKIEPGGASQKLLLIRNISEIDKAEVDTIISGMGKGINPLISIAEFTFGFEEITCHIVRLDDRLLSLLNASDGRSPLSEADEALFEAASRLDRLGMEDAFSHGACLSALKDGESVLTEAIQASPWEHWVDNNDHKIIEQDPPDYSTEERRAVVEWLIVRGVDCNLFGFEGLSPLSAAVLRHEPELVRYLLSQGANPESDQFPDEHYKPEPTAQYYASGDLNCVEVGTPEYVDVWEINVLIDVAIIEQKLTQDLSLRDILTYAPENRKWVTSVDAAYLIALAWNRRVADILEPFLVEDVVYQTQYLMEWVRGKSTVLDYFRKKMSLLPDGSDREKSFAEMCISEEGPCVFISNGLGEELVSKVDVETKDGLITRLDVCLR